MLDKTATNWQEAADELEIEGRAFINGQMTDALSGKTRPSINPATGAKLADVANCGAEDADLAIKHARAAFDSGVWSEMAPAYRKDADHLQFAPRAEGLRRRFRRHSPDQRRY